MISRLKDLFIRNFIGEYCGDKDAQLGRINLFYAEASGGKYLICAVFFDL
jgi:hypothetical protein